MTMQIGDF